MSSFVATLSGLAAPFTSSGVTASGWRSFARASSLACSSSVRWFRRWRDGVPRWVRWRLSDVGLRQIGYSLLRQRGRALLSDLDLDRNDFQAAL
jgi:hypothetical protein